MPALSRDVLVTDALRSSFENRQLVSGLSGYLRLSSASRRSLNLLLLTCFNANFRRPYRLEPESARRQIGAQSPASTAEQATPAASRHITGFVGVTGLLGRCRGVQVVRPHTATG